MRYEEIQAINKDSVERKVRRPASVSKDDWYENNNRIGRIDHEFDFDFEYVVLPL